MLSAATTVLPIRVKRNKRNERERESRREIMYFPVLINVNTIVFIDAERCLREYSKAGKDKTPRDDGEVTTGELVITVEASVRKC